MAIPILLISCTSSAQENQNLKKITSYETNKTPENLNTLKLSESEFATAHNLNGFVWTPFVLPVKNLTITNASLYAGYSKYDTEDKSESSSTHFIPPPKEGECALLNSIMDDTSTGSGDKDVTSKNSLKTQTKNYRFINTNKSQTINTALFFIIDTNHKPIAVARLNAKGESQCTLDTQPYSISMGFGRKRHEIKIESHSNIINLNFPSTSTVRINPIFVNNLKNGDIVRIGRKINFNFSKKYQEFENIIIPIKIYADLYNHADMSSHDLGIDEYLKTSFLIGTSPYQIELEQGQYVIAVLRKNKLVCFNQFVLKASSPYDLSCKETLNTEKSKDEIAYQFDFEDTIFDVGFRPSNLIKDNAFVDWTISTSGTILLGPPSFNTNEEKSLTKKDTSDFFSIVFKSKGQIVQTNYGISLEESINTFKIPLKGMTKYDLLNGQVPFSEYILAKSQKYSVPYFLSRTNTLHTNGAEISILEPTMTNSGNLFATNDQKFFVRITVPKFNSTEILEMFINDKLAKRWLLKRGNIAEPFSITESMTTYEDKNFKVKFIARGESALSNFLTGRDSFLPFAETREFCVSIDGKEICS